VPEHEHYPLQIFIGSSDARPIIRAPPRRGGGRQMSRLGKIVGFSSSVRHRNFPTICAGNRRPASHGEAVASPRSTPSSQLLPKNDFQFTFIFVVTEHPVNRI
jgi:hypothetical protein